MSRLRDKPFVLLGVNNDSDWGMLKKWIIHGDVPWRSWWDGGIQGTVARAWRVQGWPTLILIDHRGIIRYKNLLGRELDEAVDRLLREVPHPTLPDPDERGK